MIKQGFPEDPYLVRKWYWCSVFRHNRNVITTCFRLISVGLVVGLLVTSHLFAKDTVTVISKKTAVFDKAKGTAIWRDNVSVVRKSTGSTLITDKLSIERDATSDRLVWAEAAGNVKGVYFRNSTTEKGRLPEIDPNQEQEPHTVVNCDLAIFNRKITLAELSGSVDIQSKDFELQAEKIRYNYQLEQGKITAKKGEQVQFVFYKKNTPEEQQFATASSARQRISGMADIIIVNRPSRKIVLQGKVYIIDHSDQSQFQAERSELFFDELEEIEVIIANGKFSMKQPGRVSHSDRAVFEYQKEEVTLIGNAYVKEEDKVEVTSARIKMNFKVTQGIIKGVDDIPVKMEIEID